MDARSARFGVSSEAFITWRVCGEVPWAFSHLSIEERSYVIESPAITGSVMTQSEMGQRNSAGNSTDLFDASIDRCLSGSPEVLGAAADVMSSMKPYGSRFHSQCSGPDQHILDVLLSSSTVTLRTHSSSRPSSPPHSALQEQLRLGSPRLASLSHQPIVSTPAKDAA